VKSIKCLQRQFHVQFRCGRGSNWISARITKPLFRQLSTRIVEAYSTYHSGRHNVESAFGMVKGPISIRPVFVYNEQRIKGHIFICQLALLLRRVLKMLLKLSGIQMTSRHSITDRIYTAVLTLLYQGLCYLKAELLSAIKKSIVRRRSKCGPK